MVSLLSVVLQSPKTTSSTLFYKNNGDNELAGSMRMKRSKKKNKRSHKKRVVEDNMTAELVGRMDKIIEEEDEDDEICILSEGPNDIENNNNESNDNDDNTERSCRKLDRYPSLVLNADYRPLRMMPLSIWSWQNSVKAVLSGKAVVVDLYPDLYVRAVSMDMPVPSVIALREYAPTGKSQAAFTRRNVYLRDSYKCQYCYERFPTPDLSMDHVIPRSLGGKLEWENTVTSCRKCNGRKGSLLPSELHIVGMQLKSKPRRPSLYELAAEAQKFVPRRVHPTWAPYLGLDTGETQYASVDDISRGKRNRLKNPPL